MDKPSTMITEQGDMGLGAVPINEAERKQIQLNMTANKSDEDDGDFVVGEFQKN